MYEVNSISIELIYLYKMEHQRKAHFEISERKIMLRIGDILAIFLVMFLFSEKTTSIYFLETLSNLTFAIVLVFYINVIGSIFNIYNISQASSYRATLIFISLTVLISSLLYLGTPLITPSFPTNRLQILYFFLSLWMPMLIWRGFYIKFFTKNLRFSKKSVLICDPRTYHDLIKPIKMVNPHEEIVAIFDLNNLLKADKIDDIQVLKDFEELEKFITSEGVYQLIIGPLIKENKSLQSYLIKFMQNGILIGDYAHVLEKTTQKIPVDLIEKKFYHHFPISRSNSNQLYLRTVRIIEIAFSLIALIFTFVLIIPFVLLGNLLANRGPLFYKQERIGKKGIPFDIVKFRSMVVDAEKDGASFSQKGDTRITSFGKFLRKSRIDELPQLINVLQSDMGLIGPRPERQVFIDQITEKMSLYPIRHIIKPGLTGWAQINYSYGSSLEDSVEKLRYDLYYIKHRSPFLDAKILLKTINTVLFFKGQ